MGSLEALANMEYPGRFIIIGQDPQGEHDVVVYGVTGRSASSQARELVRYDHDGMSVVQVRATNRELVEQGSPSLLEYSALFVHDGRVGVSNGAQTNALFDAHMNGRHEGDSQDDFLRGVFEKDHKNGLWVTDPKYGMINLATYEPDGPNYTSRIMGSMNDTGGGGLGIISCIQSTPQSGRDTRLAEYYAVEPINGKGMLIATYAGKNPKNPQKPLPQFQWEPLRVEIAAGDAQELSTQVWEALAPAAGKNDLRVGVAVVYVSREDRGKYQIHIQNREV